MIPFEGTDLVNPFHTGGFYLSLYSQPPTILLEHNSASCSAG